MQYPRHTSGRTSLLFRAVCAIVFSTLLIESIASATTTSGTDPLTSMIQSITSFLTSATNTTTSATSGTSPSDSTVVTSQDPGSGPPPPPPPPPTY